MKTQLLFLVSFLIISNILAQQNVWVGSVDDKWSNKDNWSGEVPAPTDDVLIPSGFGVTLDTPANILSIEVQGNSVLNITSELKIANPSEFEDNVVINWSSGGLSGGGILLNSGTINMSFFSFGISESTVLNNPGRINMTGGNILISSDSVLNNSGTGIIDFKVNNGQFGATSGDLINFGTIKTSFTNPTDQAFIACDVINQDGIFQIDTGTLNLNNTNVSLNGAAFNVASGATLNLNSPMTVLGILTGNVFGDLNWSNDISIDLTAVFNFSGNTIINWVSGDLIGGGALTNSSIINKNGGGNSIINESTTLDNNNEIRLNGNGDLIIGTGSTINNNNNGLIDIRVSGSEIRTLSSGPHLLNNSGLIKTSFSNASNQSIIWAELNDNSGTIQVDNGTLSINNANATLINSELNIASGAELQWIMPLTVTGSLTGNLDGELVWDDPLVITSSASFDFLGNGIVNWKSGDLEGGGILTNNSILTKSTGISASIIGPTILNNESELRLTGASDILIGTNAIINNNLAGSIHFESTGSAIGTSGVAPNVLNNFGEIKRTVTASFATISSTVNNSGVIDAASDSFIFSGILNNEILGIIKGTGTIELPLAGNFTNNGSFGPGASPGALSVIGNYPSTTNSILEIELDGANQGVNYDLLAIEGNASLEGDIQIILSFEPSVNDEFIVVTTTGTITNCALPSTKTVNYSGFDYDFDVSCRNNNELVLTVTSKTLGLKDLEMSLSSIKLYPNPTQDITSFSDNRIIAIEVYDINGRKILSENSNSISVKRISKGIYIIKGITSENTSIVKRLIKI